MQGLELYGLSVTWQTVTEGSIIVYKHIFHCNFLGGPLHLHLKQAGDYREKNKEANAFLLLSW